MAERLACDLAVRGLVIFSGLARGVDAAAHRGAVNARGKTVAVFGTGVDIIYPKENARLAEQMLVTNKNSWGPNTLVKQGAKLTATWEDVWEELPTPVRLALTPASGDESRAGKTASLLGGSELPPHERKILKLLKAAEAAHIDEIVELLERDMSSSEIFAALFELELAGKVKPMPGKNFVKSC
jgi:predicted Rossmann fold nucleotide-binding protein DprA/Smf involved in DNA uptake